MKKQYISTLGIPEGVNVDIVNNTLKVKGKLGELERSFTNPRIVIIRNDNLITIKCKEGLKFSQKDKMFANTYKAHIKNMFYGTLNSYTAKLKVCSGHFPMNVSIDGDNFIIKNFLGEKYSRKTHIIKGVKVNIQGDEINLTGIDKESVGQMAGRIEQLTRITNRDRRIFQDGCFITQKPKGER